MNSPVTICPHNRQILKGFKGRKVAVTVRDTGTAARAAANARALGADLVCIIVETRLPLGRLAWDGDLASIPLIVIAPFFGAFRDLEPHIGLLKDLDVAIHLPSHGAGNMAGLRILSSLGIRCAAVIGTEGQDWDAIADLATYAVLGPAPHAPIEPFTHMALSGEPFPFIDWDFPCFTDSQRFVQFHDGDRPQAATGARRRPAGPCRACAGWTACRGRFTAEAAQGECSSFFREMADIAVRRARQAEARACPAGVAAPAPPSETEAREEEERGSAHPLQETGGITWIDFRGGPAQALILSGVLRQVSELHTGRRYALVARTGLAQILMKHPAIEMTGHPPKGARVLTIRATGFPGPREGEYQRLAASFGLATPVEERLWVPWEFEDERNLMALIPWKEKNVLICTASGSPRKDIPVGRWESLVEMLGRDGMGVVQAGGREDPYVRGAYNILGLLTERQFISLPRHFDVVVTSDALMTHAARLCRTPVIVPGDSPGPESTGLSLTAASLAAIRSAVARAVEGHQG